MVPAPGVGTMIAQLARDYRGPCLIYDSDAVADRIEATRALEAPHGCRVLFAAKASAGDWTLALMARGGVGFDVANAAELSAVRRATAAAGRIAPLISLSGPAAIDAFDARDVDVLHLDGTAQLRAVPPGDAVIGLRIGTLDPEHGDEKWRTRFGARPIGRDFERILSHPRFGALHCHRQGPHPVGDVTAIGAALAAVVPDRHLRFLNVGGGLGPVSPNRLGDALATLRALVPVDTTILLELGRYWFAGAGYALGRILACEPIEAGVHRVTLDLSRDCHLRWGTVTLLSANGLPKGKILLVGPTCHEGDVIGAYEAVDPRDAPAWLPPGFVCLGGVDGYAASWNRGFNGIPAARMVIHGER